MPSKNRASRSSPASSNRPNLVAVDGGRKEVEDRIRVILAELDIALPVHFEFAERVDDDAELATIENRGNGVWVLRLPTWRTPRVVKELGNDDWVCSVHRKSKRDGDCNEIKYVKYDLRLKGVDNPYPQLRRRPLPFKIYPDGDRTESTRHANALTVMPERYPALAEELSQLVAKRHNDDILLQRDYARVFVQANDRKKSSDRSRRAHRAGVSRKKKRQTGPKRPPIGLMLYAMLLKVMYNWDYFNLAHHLEGDPACQRLGWVRRRGIKRAKLRRKLFGDPTPVEVLAEELIGPGRNTLCKAFGWGRLPELFREMITTSARPGRLIDDTIIVDSHETPTVQSDNSRKSKFEGAKRKGPMVKSHFGVGKYSNYVAGVDVTMTEGRGSGDAPHLRTIARMSLEAFPNLRYSLGDLAYDVKALYSYLDDELGIKHATREKAGEDHSVGWPAAAQELARLRDKNPTAYRDRMRFRNKGEGTPSREKRRTPCQRLRRRQNALDIPPTKKQEDQVLCDLPDGELQKIFDRATASVGAPRLSEALATKVRDNLIQTVMLEQLHDQTHRFAADLAFNSIQIVKEEELPDLLSSKRKTRLLSSVSTRQRKAS